MWLCKNGRPHIEAIVADALFDDFPTDDVVGFKNSYAQAQFSEFYGTGQSPNSRTDDSYLHLHSTKFK